MKNINIPVDVTSRLAQYSPMRNRQQAHEYHEYKEFLETPEKFELSVNCIIVEIKDI